MEVELDRLREKVATAGQTAAKDQGMILRAAEERMAVVDKVHLMLFVVYDFERQLLLL